MKKNILCIFLITSIHGTASMIFTPYQALVIVPVADLAGQSLKQTSKNNVHISYQKLPICGQKGEFSCLRVHQALFHEWVTVLEDHGDEVMIKINNFFFETPYDTARHDAFWSLKKNFISLDELKKNAINIDNLPEPINYQKNVQQNELSRQTIITLLDSYKDFCTGQLFSAGTRFVATPQKKDQDSITVYFLDPANMTIKIIDLPKTIATCTDQLNRQQKIQLYVTLCQQWANRKNGFVPYVWGGCSTTNICTQDSFEALESLDHRGSSITYFKRCDEPIEPEILKSDRNPYGGFDCAGLVARAAQTAGLPYYFKNTTTLAKHLETHTNTTALQPGDLIWFPGHVMIISNLEKNTIIEARHYSHGYGKIHEIEVHKVFKNIKNFEDLKNAYANNKPLLRIDKSQKVIQTINQFKLFKMSSVF